MTRTIIDSRMTFSEALSGSVAPDEVLASLVLLDVQYLGFDDTIHEGQIVIHKDLQDEIASIFRQLLRNEFPVAKVIPIVAYDWDDQTSIRDNNTSSFNYRYVLGTDERSNHSYGVAIDINPFVNPYITESGIARPAGLKYNPAVRGAISDGDKTVRLFLDHGWEWGGHWQEQYGYIDYQHFEKLLPLY